MTSAHAVFESLEPRMLLDAGPSIIASSLDGLVAGPVRAVTLTFDEPIADGTFTLDDIAGFTGPGGATLHATAVGKLSDTQYEVTFGTADLSDVDPTQTSPGGTYRWLDIADNAYAAAYKTAYDYNNPDVSVTVASSKRWPAPPFAGVPAT